MCIEILIGGIVEGLVIVVSYLIIQHLRKRRILKGLLCPYCKADLKHEYNNNMKYCNRCYEKINFPKNTKNKKYRKHKK